MRNTLRRLSVTLLLAGTLLMQGTAVPVLAQQGETVTALAATQGIALTFPAPGATYTRIPAVTGEITDSNLDIERVYVRIYDQTTGKYYDGNGFTSNAPFEILAYGNKEWILETPGTFDTDHVFIIAVRGETAGGNSVNFADRFNFGVSEEQPETQAPPVELEPDYRLLESIVNGAQEERDRAMQAYLDSVLQQGTPINNAFSTLEIDAREPVVGSVTVTDTIEGDDVSIAVTDTEIETTVREAATGSGENMGEVCAYDPEEFIRTNSVTALLKETCRDPNILQDTLQLTPEENYNIKYKEYYDRGLLRELPQGQLNTVGLRDSDGDGLSDKVELAIGTDPFYWDSDQDNEGDGQEYLDQGTDPLDANSNMSTMDGLIITNIKDGMRTKDPRPLVVGSGKPESAVRLYEMREGTRAMLIGEATTDEGGAFLIEPFLDLEEGDHRVAASYADETGQSQTVYFIVDSSLNVPPPDITKITSTMMKPQVYGTTVFGSTVVGHFKSRLTSAQVVNDLPSGEFVVTSARALEPGSHKAILYATLPNNVRSEKVTVPFFMHEDGRIELEGFPYWILFGGALIIILIAVGSRLMRKPDTVIFSLDRTELRSLEQTNRIGQFTYETRQKLTRKDLGVKFIGFYLNTWREENKDRIILKEFIKAKPGNLLTMQNIEEMYLVPEGGGEPIDILYGTELPKDLSGYTMRYIVNVPKEILNKYFPTFDGKKLVQLKDVEHYTGKLSATLKTKEDDLI